MRITAKGQVTIPADIREMAGFLPKTYVEFTCDGEGVRIVRATPGNGRGRGARVVSQLRGRGDVALSTDEIMAMTRGLTSAILVDSNVLLDLLTEDPEWFDWSADAIERGADQSRLLINQVIYAELSVRFSQIEDLEAVLSQAMIGRDSIPFEAAFLAAKAFVIYRRRG